MALQSSGRITLKNIADEFGDTAPHSMSEFYGAASGVPTSGQIKHSNFYGKASAKSVTLTVYGAEGGSNGGNDLGGQGGTLVWNGTMAPGTVLTLYVGQKGGNSTNSIRMSGGGGGGSAVFIGGTLIAVGGGGGGAGADGDNAQNCYGGKGGADTGQQGGPNNHAGSSVGGYGGSQSGPGASGTGSRGSGSAGSGPNGGSYNSGGGAGGWGYGTGGTGEYDAGDGGVGAGGGGYYGGGTGGQSASGAGGGGGSNYRRTSGLPSGVTYTSSTTTQGGKTGNGQIVVTVDGASTTYNYIGNTTQSRTI